MTDNFDKRLERTLYAPKMKPSYWTFMQNGSKKELVSVDVTTKPVAKHRVITKVNVKVI